MAGMIYEILLIGMQHQDADPPVDWARENCPSFRGLIILEEEYILDESVRFQYLFEKEQDAILFGLKFGSH